jgi:hypothetical protein
MRKITIKRMDSRSPVKLRTSFAGMTDVHFKTLNCYGMVDFACCGALLNLSKSGWFAEKEISRQPVF